MITDLVRPPKSWQSFPTIDSQLQKDLVQLFKLLADENRLRILLDLGREGELNVTTICDRLGQSQPAVSHHLALLRVGGLIACRREGKHNYYSVRKEHFLGLIRELFQCVGGEDHDSEIRFDDLVLRQLT